MVDTSSISSRIDLILKQTAFRYNPFPTIDTNRINNQITAPELRVIDSQGGSLGVMSREAALALAKEQGLDLIEVAANAKPPVAKLISFDKYRYEREKAAKKERQHQKGSDLKQIQISVRMAENDLKVKLKKTLEFLEGGHPVEIRMRLRGREKANKDWAKEKLKAYLSLIELPYKFISEIKANGNGFGTTIVSTLKK